jgi:hypothetical protein
MLLYNESVAHRSSIAESRVFDSWLDYQDALKCAIAPQGSWARVRCPVSARRARLPSTSSLAARSICITQRASELVPLQRWAQAGYAPRTAAQIVAALDLTWRYFTDCVARGMAAVQLTDDEALIVQTIWGLLDRDLPRAGELSLLLGAAGLPGVEI